MSKSIRATIIASAYFFIYAIVYFTFAPAKLLIGMLIASPLVLIYWVYMVISDRSYKTRDLKDDEEFSYKDWPEASERKEDQ